VSPPGTRSGSAGGPFRLAAELLAPVETPTPFGGLARTWGPAATLWLDLLAGPGRELSVGEQRPLRVENALAIARDHPLAARGLRLQIGAEPPWRILSVARDHPAPGLMSLSLDRTG
jgi:hypothetical protein